MKAIRRQPILPASATTSTTGNLVGWRDKVNGRRLKKRHRSGLRGFCLFLECGAFPPLFFFGSSKKNKQSRSSLHGLCFFWSAALFRRFFSLKIQKKRRKSAALQKKAAEK